MVEYDTPMKGQGYIQGAKEQIQEDVITYMEGYTAPFTFTDEDKQSITDDVCDIVVNGFKALEK